MTDMDIDSPAMGCNTVITETSDLHDGDHADAGRPILQQGNPSLYSSDDEDKGDISDSEATTLGGSRSLHLSPDNSPDTYTEFLAISGSDDNIIQASQKWQRCQECQPAGSVRGRAGRGQGSVTHPGDEISMEGTETTYSRGVEELKREGVSGFCGVWG